jgi:hypothetical protein
VDPQHLLLEDNPRFSKRKRSASRRFASSTSISAWTSRSFSISSSSGVVMDFVLSVRLMPQGVMERRWMQLIPGAFGEAKITGHLVPKAVNRRKNP